MFFNFVIQTLDNEIGSKLYMGSKMGAIPTAPLYTNLNHYKGSNPPSIVPKTHPVKLLT